MPTPPQVYDTLLKALRHPVPLGGSRGMPRLVLVTDSALAETLADLFLRAQVEVAVGEGTPPPDADEAIREFERMTNAHSRGKEGLQHNRLRCIYPL